MDSLTQSPSVVDIQLDQDNIVIKPDQETPSVDVEVKQSDTLGKRSPKGESDGVPFQEDKQASIVKKSEALQQQDYPNLISDGRIRLVKSNQSRRGKIKPKLKPKGETIFMQSIISRKVILDITNVGRLLKQNLEKTVANQVEGKCVVEGFVKPQSCRLVTYNSGVIRNGKITFEVIFECETCSPVEGMLIDCVAKNITKAGIRAEVDSDVSPVVIFVARDHNELNDYFNSITEDDRIRVRVIGKRFELNDKYVSVIAKLIE